MIMTFVLAAILIVVMIITFAMWTTNDFSFPVIIISFCATLLVCLSVVPFVPYQEITPRDYKISHAEHVAFVMLDGKLTNLNKLFNMSFEEDSNIRILKHHGFWAGPVYKSTYYKFYYDDKYVGWCEWMDLNN